MTYTYEFTAGCGLVIDDKLGVIGDSNGETLSATTTLTETTTNFAVIQPTNCVCIDGNGGDSVTVTVGPPTPTPTPTGCAATWPRTGIVTIAKGQSPANNPKVYHAITGNIIDPGSLGINAHRIEVCAGTGVSALVFDTSGPTPTNTSSGTLTCSSTGCSGTVNVTEKYQSVSTDGKDKDTVTFIPK